MEFLPQPKGYLQDNGVLEHTWFHVSDEPGMNDIDSYRSAVLCMRRGLGDCRILDALSDFEFYRLGLAHVRWSPLTIWNRFWRRGFPICGRITAAFRGWM